MAINQEEGYLQRIDYDFISKEKIDINDIQFKRIMFFYESALKEIKTKFEILKDELKIFYGYEPIEYITTRIKEPTHIIEKMQRKELTLTYKNMYEKINDIAGIRIVCNFKKDVYRIVQILENFQDLKIIKKKDYLKEPKKSGYMSYHIITEVPISISTGIMFVKVEIQVRTIGMDFWASLEHKLKYKNNMLSKKDSNHLIKYAQVINNIDDNMLNISENIEESTTKYFEVAGKKSKKKFDFKL